MTSARLSQHSVDTLIRGVFDGTHRPTGSDVEQIIERIATAPFDPRIRTLPVDLPVREFGGRRLEAAEPAVIVHLLTRIYLDHQWSADTLADDYLADLRAGVRTEHARLGLYVRRGGYMAAVTAETDRIVPAGRRGTTMLPHLLVLYSADRGIIVSGYQFSAMSAVAMPEDVLWLK